jgi:hypothetical protein
MFSTQPVTHIPGVSDTNPTKTWEDKICARCAIAYYTDSLFDIMEFAYNGTVEFDPDEADL